MAKEWQYIPGDEWGICDSCGSKVRRSQMKLRWDNLMVCPDDFELRHPQDFVKARIDKITIPYPRPRPADVFVVVFQRAAIAGLAIAGQATAGWSSI